MQQIGEKIECRIGGLEDATIFLALDMEYQKKWNNLKRINFAFPLHVFRYPSWKKYQHVRDMHTRLRSLH